MKTFLFLAASVISLAAHSQISKVSLQASGLTCSMCSNSINKSLKTVDFVQSISPNIGTSTFEISFKPGSKVDFEILRKKVENAGFTVSKFIATVNLANVHITGNQPVKVGDKTFYFSNVKDQSFNGPQQVKVMNKGFVSGKEYKKNPQTTVSAGADHIYNVIIAGA